jgi:hypothetical protein
MSKFAGAVLVGLLLVGVAEGGPKLSNGIVLPQPWPPHREKFVPATEADPQVAPYLVHPPECVPIDQGRQLFVDDFLVAETGLKRTCHAAVPYPGNPVLRPDKPWEFEGEYKGLRGPYAMPFSDGVWFDPRDKLYKMWYMGGLLHATCYAVSTDGMHWQKPTLDVKPGTNIVHAGNRDSSTVWLDLAEKDPGRRFKMLRFEKAPKRGLALHFSADGIHWSDEVRRAGPTYDRSTFFFNPFRGVWVYSLKAVFPDLESPGRFQVRRYWEQEDLLRSPVWNGYNDALLWANTDRLDPPSLIARGERAFIYNLDATPYESVLLGLFTLHQRPADREAGRPKRNELFVGFSRDGFHWHRPMRTPFLGVSERRGDWNWGNVQSVGGGCLIVGDKLWFYYSGRAGSGRLGREKSFWDADGAAGLAFLRRDGFVSMDAGEREASLTTRPVKFSGRHLFVNADASQGRLAVEVLDAQGHVIPPFSIANCTALRADGTRQSVRWAGGADLASLAGKPVRFRFHLLRGRLYSFWVSPSTSGVSHGYVAAGGPGLTGPSDGTERM